MGPFNTPSFRPFAASAASQIELAEEGAHLALKNFPENIAFTVRSAVAALSLEQKREREATKSHQDKMQYLTATGSRPSRSAPNLVT
jgi:hypothetical protein